MRETNETATSRTAGNPQFLGTVSWPICRAGWCMPRGIDPPRTKPDVLITVTQVTRQSAQKSGDDLAPDIALAVGGPVGTRNGCRRGPCAPVKVSPSLNFPRVYQAYRPPPYVAR